MPMQRRISAIFAADMVGYSRLMEADEVGTLTRQKSHRQELIDPALDKFGGRIVKEMGDGILVEFHSVVDAVQCAVSIQREMNIREDAVDDSRRIRYRIGINLGDVIAENGDLYGDGVNVAARLEQLAEPGGICISGTAYDQMHSTADIGYRALGEVRVKNIEREIRAYKVLIEAEGVAGVKPAPRKISLRRTGFLRFLFPGVLAAAVMLGAGIYYYQPWVNTTSQTVKLTSAQKQGKQAIAILPFDNLNTASDDEYLAAGISEDLIAELSTVPELLVIMPGSSSAKMPAGNLKDTAKEMGVDYLVTGAIRRIGTDFRINAALIDGASGASLWAKAYDRSNRELFSLSGEIGDAVINALPAKLSQSRKSSTNRVHFPDPIAYDLLLKANVLFAQFTPGLLEPARELYLQASEIDPEYARPVANLAFILGLEVSFGWSKEPEKDFAEAQRLIDKALKLDPATHQAYLARGLLYRSQKRYGEAIAAFDKAIEIAPNNADAYAMISLTYVFEGKPDEALQAIEGAMIRNPDHPFFYLYTKAMALFHLERFEEAADALKLALEKNPDFVLARLVLASTYAHLNMIDDAQWEYQEVIIRLPDFSLIREQARAPYSNPNDLQRYMEGLRIAAGEN
jgi:adenylate cyclase